MGPRDPPRITRPHAERLERYLASRVAAVVADPRAPAVSLAVTVSASCTTGPSARIASVTTRRGRLTVRGTARAGCASLQAVEVTVARKGAGGCRFLGAKGRLGRVLPCTARVGLVVSGRRSWTLRPRVPRGTYRVTVRAVDTAARVSTARSAAVRG